MLRSAVNTCVALAMGAVVLAPAAHAADTTTIVLYAETRGIARIDTNAPGPDHGDVVDREYAMSRMLGGPVIGVTYSESIVVAYNPQAKIDVRRVDTQKVLPGGTLATTGLSELAIGTLPQPGWTDTYAVIGGTGKYAGARGTEKLTLLSDGKTFKVVITLIK